MLFVFSHRQEELKEALFWPDSRTFSIAGFKEYLSLSIPSTFMICLDWWIWEFMILISGKFGNVD